MKVIFLEPGLAQGGQEHNHAKRELEVAEGSTGADVAQNMGKTSPEEALALNLNGVLRDLVTPLQEGDHFSFVDFSSAEGKEIFWHTSAHVLAQAVLRLYPKAKPTIGPAIEEGFYYDFANLHISEEDFPAIEEEVENVLKEGYHPVRAEFENAHQLESTFCNNPYKMELLQGLTGQASTYKQGEFIDLCRGPHIPSLKKIRAFALTKTSGAYWRADKEREMLTRVYGISFPDRKMLRAYQERIAEARKRDHKILGPQLDLFLLREEAPGIPFILPHGMHVWNTLLDFLRELLAEDNYVEIKTPQLMGQSLWKTSGHWDHYRENMYAFSVEEREFALKPMNCPGCMLFYQSRLWSYRDLPLRVAEIGNVFRHEASGALSGLMRVRSFHQDDAHIFMRPTDIKNEIISILRFVERLYGTFGLEYCLELSTRPEESMGSDEDWEVATRGLRSALDSWGAEYKVNPGDGAFYGPKIDIHIRDALNRSWQCGTIQLDMFLPQRFSLFYKDSDGMEKQPIMVHRAIFGSLERFFGILIEHFAGKLPLWISPRPLVLLPVSQKHYAYAEECAQEFYKHGFLCELRVPETSLGKRIREAQLNQCNYMLTLGDQEESTHTVSVRRRDNVVCGTYTLEGLLSLLKRERAERLLQPQVQPK